MNDIKTTLKLAAALRELLEISKTDAWSEGSMRLDDALVDAREALRGFKEPEDHSEMLSGMNLAEANWWFIENVSSDDPMRDTYYWLLRERNAEGCSESGTLDALAYLFSDSEWDADICDQAAELIRNSGRDVSDLRDEEEES